MSTAVRHKQTWILYSEEMKKGQQVQDRPPPRDPVANLSGSLVATCGTQPGTEPGPPVLGAES